MQGEKYHSVQEDSASKTGINRQLIATLETMNEGFVALDQNGRCTYMNPYAGKIFEKDPQTQIGKSIWSEFPEEFSHNCRTACEKAMHEQVPVEIENYYSRADKWFLNRIVPTAEGLSIFFQDITNGKKTEAALKRSEEKFNKAFYNAPVAITITRASDGMVLDVNDGIQGISGYTRDQVKGNSSITLNAWAHIEDRSRYLSILKEKGRVNNFDTQMRLRSGELRDFELSGEVYESDGELLILTLFQDVTERKKAEENWQAREHELSLIYSNVHDAIFYIQVEQNSNFRFLSVNKAFLELTGLKKDQVINKLVQDIIPEPSVFKVIENYKKCIHQNRTLHWEEISDYPTGKKVGLVTVTPIFDQDGVCTHLIGTVYDITENKIAEEEIKKLNQSLEMRVAERTAQFEAANKELESFSYSISHDLRSPLRAIYGFSQILSSRHRSSLNEEGKQYMDYILQSTIRMEQLINDLLDYSRLGRKSVQLHPVSLKSIVQAVYSDFENQLREIKGQFIVAGELREILGDESLLSQIFTNLISNAIHYRRTDIPLIIRISGEQSAGGYVIKVSDNGIGIPREHFEKIFNVFQRLHSEDKYSGTGIGLANVKKAVHLLGAKIIVESTVGEGSTFSVVFPENRK